MPKIKTYELSGKWNIHTHVWPPLGRMYSIHPVHMSKYWYVVDKPKRYSDGYKRNGVHIILDTKGAAG